MAKAARATSSTPGPILDPRQHVFETILGHEKVKRLLRSMVESQRLPKAILLHGRPGVGKRSLAYAFVKYLNSYPEGDRADCATAACRKIARGVFFDLIEIAPSGPGGQIRVESAHEAEDRLATAPIEGRYKVLLILDAHRMNLATANALLKTIEEPPSYALILLVTDRPSMLPATIRSRCSTIRCGEIKHEALADWLLRFTPAPELQRSSPERRGPTVREGAERGQRQEARGETPERSSPNVKEGPELQRRGPTVREGSDSGRAPDREHARFLALLAEGRPGQALALIGAGLLERRDEAVQALLDFHTEGYRAFMRTAWQLGKGQENLANALALLFTWYRDLLVARLAPGDPSLLLHRDHADVLEEIAPRFPVKGLIAALDHIARRYALADRIANTQLVLESLLVDVGTATKK